MKVLLLNSTDIQGGAARAAYRLHSGLRAQGLDSAIFVQQKFSSESTVFAAETKLEKAISAIRPTLDALPVRLYKQPPFSFFSPQWLPGGVSKKIEKFNPDVVNLHWICKGFVGIRDIAAIKRPVVWTLHDMWAFTGGCHYTHGCESYRDSCGSCPQLNSRRKHDLSHLVWRMKKGAWKDLDITIVTPSSWLADCVRSSSLLGRKRVEVIPNGIDTEKYRPFDKMTARKLLNLPLDKKLILFGALGAASDPRKGFSFIKPALERLCDTGWRDQVQLVVFGTSEGVETGFTTHFLGSLNDDLTLSLAYSSADVFVLPSTEDNLPNTIMEALSCGTPCVAFDIGGISDMIVHMQNGYLVSPFDTEALAGGISWVIGNDERMMKLGESARNKAISEYSQKVQAERYIELFSELAEKHKKLQ